MIKLKNNSQDQNFKFFYNISFQFLFSFEVFMLFLYLVTFVEFFFPFHQFFFLLREVNKLIQRLLVHMTVLLEFFITMMQFLPQLIISTRAMKREQQRLVINNSTGQTTIANASARESLRQYRVPSRQKFQRTFFDVFIL